MTVAVTVSVKILDEEYQVSCDEGEEDDLASAARDLDRRMRRIRESGKVFGVDRMAVLAALNVAHEGMLASREVARAEHAVRKLVERVDRALANAKAD